MQCFSMLGVEVHTFKTSKNEKHWLSRKAKHLKGKVRGGKIPSFMWVTFQKNFCANPFLIFPQFKSRMEMLVKQCLQKALQFTKCCNLPNCFVLLHGCNKFFPFWWIKFLALQVKVHVWGFNYTDEKKTIYHQAKKNPYLNAWLDAN